MTNKKKMLFHILQVAFSNLSTIVSGVIIGFVIPKILSVEGYGLYKIFTLYASYLGFCSLGIIDGIVLDYGGIDYEKIDRPLFRGFFQSYLIVNIVFSIVLAFVGVFFVGGRFGFILVMLALDLIGLNISGYYQQISQITQRFREFSIRKVLQSVANIINVGIMILVFLRYESVEYSLYIILTVVVNLLLAGWYVYTYRDLSFGKTIDKKDLLAQVVSLIKKGFPLLFANLCSSLILSIDRQFVSILFPAKSYAVYAFAYNMLSLITIATSAIATVIYPYLKRLSAKEMKSTFTYLVSLMLIIISAINVAYYPLACVVNWILPNYQGSIPIFRIIFPGLTISSVITIVFHNYYKSLGMSFSYFKKSVIILVLSCIANGVAYCCFKNMFSISIASIITMIIWYCYVERWFIRHYEYKNTKNLIYLVSMMACFYLSTTFSGMLYSCIIYCIGYILLTGMFFRNQIVELLKKRK
ncbi:MAG: oligosaccharide flippase family protein [Oliverpabstia sp.]|nr:oligosaccharide flippase family protein [Oliverpabstia sp.]